MDAMPHTIAPKSVGASIHPSAVVHRNAEIGDNVRIGPYCTIGADVLIEDGAELVSHVVVDGHPCGWAAMAGVFLAPAAAAEFFGSLVIQPSNNWMVRFP